MDLLDYKSNDWCLRGKMTCDVPQGSKIGPFIWNVMYDGFQKTDVPQNTVIIGFADDALVVYWAESDKILGV